MDLADWIDRWAGFEPDKPAMHCAGEVVTYRDFAHRIDRMAAVLRHRLDVRRGDRVAWLGYNRCEALTLLFACARLGAIFLPLNWRLAPPEHRLILDDAGARALFVETDFLAATETICVAGDVFRRIAVGGARPGWLDYAALVAEDDRLIQGAQGAGADDPAVICYTSGTTGLPKGAVLTQRNLLFNAINSIHMHDLVSGDRILTTLPIFHVGGLNIQTLPALHSGATVVFQAKFDPTAVFDAVEQHRPTLTVLVPTQLRLLMEHPRWATADLTSLRCITTGSTLVPESLIHAVHDRGVPLIQVYGSTETGPIAAFQRIADAERKLGSAGRSAVHCALRVVDLDGADAAPGGSGEILVKGPNVTVGYWNDAAATAQALRGDWFHTGDIGHFDDDGYLYVDGRKKEMIISGGENIYPAALESILTECPDIAEAAVVGRPDDYWGEVVVAVVVPRRPGLTRDDVLNLFAGRVARYKLPRDVVFVDYLPRNAMGKLQKEEIRRRLPSAEANSVEIGTR
jgi:fatty-acyl-CoA synthase